MHFKVISARCYPAFGSCFDLFRCCRLNSVHRLPECAGIILVDGICREDVGFATKAANTFEAAHESRSILSFDPLQFVISNAVFQESFNFLIQRLFNCFHIATRLHRCHGHEHSTDFIANYASLRRSGNLVVVNQALIEA